MDDPISSKTGNELAYERDDHHSKLLDLGLPYELIFLSYIKISLLSLMLTLMIIMYKVKHA